MPNQLVDQLSHLKYAAEIKVVLYILRHTWGFYGQQKHITMDEFIHGRKRRGGSRMDGGTGLCEKTVQHALHLAVQHSFIARDDDSDLGRIKKYYHLRVHEAFESCKSVAMT